MRFTILDMSFVLLKLVVLPEYKENVKDRIKNMRRGTAANVMLRCCTKRWYSFMNPADARLPLKVNRTSLDAPAPRLAANESFTVASGAGHQLLHVTFTVTDTLLLFSPFTYQPKVE